MAVFLPQKPPVGPRAALSQFRCHSPAGCQKFRCRVGLHSARKIMTKRIFLTQRGVFRVPEQIRPCSQGQAKRQT